MKYFLSRYSILLFSSLFITTNLFAQACEDTDNGAADSYGDGCHEYNSNTQWCNGYDDDDFVSSEMCCACGGGLIDSLIQSIIGGCTNESAQNFNPDATWDDGSCNFPGCTNPTSCNYNNAANIDDGSCDGLIGCTDSSYLEFNEDATCDNNSCSTLIVSGCADESASNYNSEATDDDGSCNYICNPGWAVIGTDQNHSIFFTPNVVWSGFDGNELAAGSLIGVFYQDENGDFACAGYTAYAPGQTVQIAAMGDDSQTEEIDGLVAGQELVFHVWDVTLCELFSAEVQFGNGPEVFTGNGITFVNNVSAQQYGPSNQIIPLPSGWSMFSSYISPEVTDIVVVLSELVDGITIVKDYLGNAYLPDWNFNAIGSLNNHQGYQIKLSQADTLSISGEYVVPEEHPNSLMSGWSIMGYLRLDSVLMDVLLADLVLQDYIIIVKDYLGNAYLPDWNFNAIGHAQPGFGYQIKTTQECILHYLPNSQSYRLTSSLKVIDNQSTYIPRATITDNNMTLIIADQAWDVLPSKDAEISAFDSKNNMVGSSRYTSPTSIVTLWGNDQLSYNKDGLYIGEQVYFNITNGFIITKKLILSYSTFLIEY